MKKHSLSLPAFALIVGLTAPSQAATVLANFVSGPAGLAANRNINAVSAADYQANDAAVELSASVTEIAFNRNAPFTVLPDATTLNGVGASVDVTVTGSGDVFGFVATDGSINDRAIVDSYIAVNGAATPIEFTISGLEEFVAGTDFTAVIYAVGDAANQGATTTVTYNGAPQVGVTNAGTPVEFGSYTFTKVDGVNEITISSVGESQFHAVNGFSLTGTVPEPSSALLVGLAGITLLRRRRRA